MKILIPGSFDPPTNGHIDVINMDIYQVLWLKKSTHMEEMFLHLFRQKY